MKIGLYGGSFDPIHNAHLLIAQYILEELNLQNIIFIPSGIPPHKEVFSQPEHRLEMTNLAIEKNPFFECSDLEIEMTQPSYTVNTIQRMRRKLVLEKDSLFWIMGSDNFLDFASWKEPEKIIQLCHLVVFPRSYHDAEKFPPEFKNEIFYLDKAPLIGISSSGVRDLIKKNRSVAYWVPKEVDAYIKRHNIYT